MTTLFYKYTQNGYELTDIKDDGKREKKIKAVFDRPENMRLAFGAAVCCEAVRGVCEADVAHLENGEYGLHIFRDGGCESAEGFALADGTVRRVYPTEETLRRLTLRCRAVEEQLAAAEAAVAQIKDALGNNEIFKL